MKKWKTVGTKTVCDFSPWFTVQRDVVILPSGRVIDDYYRISAPDYVIVCAVNNDGRVMLEKQFKQCLGKFILTCPAGGIESDETPQEAAIRELLEETGYIARDWKFLMSPVVDGTRGICKAHMFLAESIEKVSDAIQSDAEDIEITFLSSREIDTAVTGGSICLLPDIALLSLVGGMKVGN